MRRPSLTVILCLAAACFGANRSAAQGHDWAPGVKESMRKETSTPGASKSPLFLRMGPYTTSISSDPEFGGSLEMAFRAMEGPLSNQMTWAVELPVLVMGGKEFEEADFVGEFLPTGRIVITAPAGIQVSPGVGVGLAVVGIVGRNRMFFDKAVYLSPGIRAGVDAMFTRTMGISLDYFRNSFNTGRTYYWENHLTLTHWRLAVVVNP